MIDSKSKSIRILVVRNDKLGDFMLAWPVFALIKQHFPSAIITVLIPDYTAPLARLCPWIDSILISPVNKRGKIDIISLRRQLVISHFDAVLTLYSTMRVALATCLASIPYRIAPATKLAQVCYNHRVLQRRSKSERPEYAYNLELAYRLISDFTRHDIKLDLLTSLTNDYLPTEIQRPLLQFDSSKVQQWRDDFCLKNNINHDTFLVFIHPGSGGSANNLRHEQYAELANKLIKQRSIYFVITAGPGEERIADALKCLIYTNDTIVLQPEHGLVDLARMLSFADLFISGSTGPMHIAAALNRCTATFYPRHRSGCPLRWQGLNSPHHRLSFTPPDNADEKDVSSIDIQSAADEITMKFLS